MKNLLLLVLLIAGLNIQLKAQNFAYDTTTTISMEGDAGGLFEATIHFLPFDSSDITFKWATLENTLSPEWSYSLCDYNNCYVNVPDSATMFSLSTDDYNNNVLGFFKLLVSTDDSAAEGTLRLLLFDSANVAAADTIVFNLKTHEVIDTTDTTDVTGYATWNKVAFEVFPNPTTDVITLLGSDVDHVEVLNILGQSQPVEIDRSNAAIRIDMQTLPTGTYLILATQNGVTTSQTVVKQ